MIKIHLGSLKEKTFVSYQLGRIGCDWILLISGGKSHIGSVACSQNNRMTDEVWQITLGAHKENKIVRNATLRLKDILKGEILVIGGIHYDRISRNQIQQIEKHCDTILKLIEAILIKEGYRD
jgi:gallate decarboxylase subunit D